MSIQPLSLNDPAAALDAASAPAPRPQSVSPGPRPRASSPDSAPGPKPERSNNGQPSHAEELRQDVVQVQQGSETDGRIVIRYLDHAGNVILQIPSSQVLGLARAIQQALDKQLKSTATPAANLTLERQL